MTKRVLIFAAHPDDEILGLGGTTKKLVNNGYEVTTVILANGRKEEEEHIKLCIPVANGHLGVSDVRFLQYPNLKLETIPLHIITKEIEIIINELDPDILFTHHYGDLNRDHQITFQAVQTAVRPLPGKKPLEFLCFETVSSSEWSHPINDKIFKPNFFVDISDTFNEKMKALQYYDAEMRVFPHPRSYKGIEYLARVRGMTVGVEFAEAFETIRRVWK